MMRFLPAKNQFAKIFVIGNHNAFFGKGVLQNGRVVGFGHYFRDNKNVMPLCL